MHGDRAAVAGRLADAPDRVDVAERRVRDQPVLDRAVVALGLAQVDRDRAERLIGAHDPRSRGQLAGLAAPLDLEVADHRGLEDLAPTLGAEPGHRRELDVTRAGRELDGETVALQVHRDVRRYD